MLEELWKIAYKKWDEGGEPPILFKYWRVGPGISVVYTPAIKQWSARAYSLSHLVLTRQQAYIYLRLAIEYNKIICDLKERFNEN